MIDSDSGLRESVVLCSKGAQSSAGMFVWRTWHRRRRPPYHRGWRTGSGRRRRKTWNDTAVGPRQRLLAGWAVRHCGSAPPAEVRDELSVRAFALIAAYLRGDLEALDALVDDDAGELLVMVTEVLVGALLKLVPREEIERQVNGWLAQRREGFGAG